MIKYDSSVIGCTSHELLDKERTLPRTRTISEAMRQNCTWRLRTDFKKWSEKMENFFNVLYERAFQDESNEPFSAFLR